MPNFTPLVQRVAPAGQKTLKLASSGGANVHPIYRKPKMVAMATSFRTSKLAMSSSDSLTPKAHL